METPVKFTVIMETPSQNYARFDLLYLKYRSGGLTQSRGSIASQFLIRLSTFCVGGLNKMGTKNHSALNTGAGNMVLSIYCSELTIADRYGNDLTAMEADENGYVFVSGMDAVNSKGALLFSVSGSDEYNATVHNVLSYTITKGTFRQAAYVVAVVGDSLDD